MCTRRFACMVLMALLTVPAGAQTEDDPDKKDEPHVLFIVAGIQQSKAKWLELDRELRKLPGLKRVDVVPVEDEEFCQARAVYDGLRPSEAELVAAAKRAGFDALTLAQAKQRFAGDPKKRIFLDIPSGVIDKEDAINLEIPIRQIDGVRRVIVVFDLLELDPGAAIVIISYDKQKPELKALIEAAGKSGFKATERKTGLPSSKK